MIKHVSRLSIFLALLPAFACGGDDDGDGDGDIGSYAVTGTAVDFETGEAIDGSATVSTSGLTPPPTISTTGADFTIEGVPPFSVFNILAGSPPEYRSTYNIATEVEESNVDGIEARVLSESYLASLEEAFAAEADAGTGVLIAQVVDEGGQGVAGVPAAAFAVNNAAPLAGPYFLDDALQPDPEALETSASGYVVFYSLEPGLVSVSAAEGSGYTMVMASAPVAPTAATVSVITITDGEVEIPTGVSFANDVRPIFERRGCEICHSGNGIGRDLGNLTLDSADNLIYRELTEEISPNHQVTRIDLENPPGSLVLTMPSPEDPPDAHPNVTFASPADPDYLMLLGWITDGAPQN
jgi:hypothetical protein